MSFENAMRASGLRPKAIIADGKWRRCKTDDKPTKANGAYVLHPDGRGFWRNWATDLELNSWTDESQTRAAQVDPAKVQRMRDAERAQRMAAIRRAREFWASSSPMRGQHPYLEDKGLSMQGCASLRVFRELLVVPIWHGQSLLNVQTIGPDGRKLFKKHAPVKGGSFVFERPGAPVTVLAEGFATGLAIYQCVRKARVIVAFDAGNLMPVAERMKPSGSVVIAADNDHQTLAKRGFNPGLRAANNVAELIECGVAYPTDIEGTDWADALREWGQEGARRIEREILKHAKYVMSKTP